MFSESALTIIRRNIDDIARSSYVNLVATIYSSSFGLLKKRHRGTGMHAVADGGVSSSQGFIIRSTFNLVALRFRPNRRSELLNNVNLFKSSASALLICIADPGRLSRVIVNRNVTPDYVNSGLLLKSKARIGSWKRQRTVDQHRRSITIDVI
jgi:hypothetical protein